VSKPNIPKEYEKLLTPVDELEFLPGNPRKGAVAAIKASYEKYGQTKPIVAYEDEDGVKTVIAGNHQLMAAREMGWPVIAVIVREYSETEAVGYALADNRLGEMGTVDDKLLFDMIGTVIDDLPDFMEELGWDDFELSLMEPLNDADIIDTLDDHSQGWQPPELVTRGSEEDEDDDEMHWTGDKDDQKELITQGSTSAGVSGSNKAVFQYTLVFDSPQQQAAWYTFLRWLKPRTHRYPGETTTEQLVSFLEAMTEEGEE